MPIVFIIRKALLILITGEIAAPEKRARKFSTRRGCIVGTA
jgi:hypothetical protein